MEAFDVEAVDVAFFDEVMPKNAQSSQYNIHGGGDRHYIVKCDIADTHTHIHLEIQIRPLYIQGAG